MEQRLKFIDCLRGMSMLFVVFHHIIVMGMRDTIGGAYMSPVNDFIITIQMPLFFFVSGFVSARLNRDWSVQSIRMTLMKKVNGQLIPTIIMFLICMLVYNLNIADWVFVPFKCGYWFTWVSFQIFAIWFVVSYLLRHFNVNVASIGILLLSALLLFASLRVPLTNKVVGFLSLNYTFQYFIYFIVGVVFKYNYENICRWIDNKLFISGLFLFAITPWFYPVGNQYANAIISIMRVICCFAIFRQLSIFSESNLAANTLSYIGKHTLEIYFLHYFLLFKLDFLALWLNNFSSDYCFRGHSCVLLPEVLTIGLLAIIISFTCIGIRKTIDVFPIMSTLMFGPQNKQKR